ncbi:MAG: hypothetical protein ACI38Y_06225 [Candidatus Methanomethylophilaceae archaeon]
MSPYRLLALVPMVVVLALILAPSADAAKDTEEKPPAPWELYPDADYIVTAAEDGSVLFSFWEETEVTEETPEGIKWTTRTYPSGSDITVSRWSQVDPPSIGIVFDGATVDDLVVIQVDDSGIRDKYVSVNFRMVSGYIDSLSLVSVNYSQQSALGNDYDYSMFNPIDEAVIVLDGGRIGDFIPTAHMVHVESMSVSIGSSMTVDRFYTTGQNGRYGDVDIMLLGGTVGYMANMKSRIGTISYYMEHGTVRYMAIGADTEAGDNYKGLQYACTSYVTGDVDVYIGPTVNVGYLIMGGGITNNPNILWNGTVVQDTPVRNVSIEAGDYTVHADTCFMNEKRTHSFKFSSFKVEGSPGTSTISQSYKAEDGSSMPVYGEDGIWMGTSYIGLPSGTSLFVNSVLVVNPDGVLDISVGGRLVITEHMVLQGTVNAVGEFVNNSVVELRDNGEVVGSVSGDGFIADYIVSQTTGSSINIMSSYDTVIISQQNSRYVSEIDALLKSGQCKVRISLQYSGMAFGSDTFMISLREVNFNESFTGAYTLHVEGIDPSLLEICSISVDVPLSVPLGYEVKVYYYGSGSSDPVEVECDSPQYGQIEFHTNQVGLFGIMLSSTDQPTEVQPRENILEIVILLIGIAVVSILMVYTVFYFRTK